MWKKSIYLWYHIFGYSDILTISILSRAAKARMSAQETTPLHTASSLAFAASITSKPLRLGLLGGESFSAVFEGVESMSTDPSHPYFHIKQVCIIRMVNYEVWTMRIIWIFKPMDAIAITETQTIYQKEKS